MAGFFRYLFLLLTAAGLILGPSINAGTQQSCVSAGKHSAEKHFRIGQSDFNPSFDCFFETAEESESETTGSEFNLDFFCSLHQFRSALHQNFPEADGSGTYALKKKHSLNKLLCIYRI